jgi:hypothetical protein
VGAHAFLVLEYVPGSNLRHHGARSGNSLGTISGLFIDHIDHEKLADKRRVEASKTIRAQVQAIHERQLERFR